MVQLEFELTSYVTVRHVSHMDYLFTVIGGYEGAQLLRPEYTPHPNNFFKVFEQPSKKKKWI